MERKRNPLTEIVNVLESEKVAQSLAVAVLTSKHIDVCVLSEEGEITKPWGKKILKHTTITIE